MKNSGHVLDRKQQTVTKTDPKQCSGPETSGYTNMNKIVTFAHHRRLYLEYDEKLTMESNCLDYITPETHISMSSALYHSWRSHRFPLIECRNPEHGQRKSFFRLMRI